MVTSTRVRRRATAPGPSARARFSPPTTTVFTSTRASSSEKLAERELRAPSVASGASGDPPHRRGRGRAGRERDAGAGGAVDDDVGRRSASVRRRRVPSGRGRASRDRAWRSTASCTGMVTRDRRGTTSACKPGRFLRAGVGDERDVDDGVVAERVEQQEVVRAAVDGGARREVPVGARRCACTTRPRRRRSCSRRCDTATGPPTDSTTTPGSGVASTSATGTSTSSPGARRMRSVAGAASPPGITVMVTSMSVRARLATTTVSVAAPSGDDVPAAQYQVLDATSAAGTPTLARGHRTRRRATTSGADRTRSAAPRPRRRAPPPRRTGSGRAGRGGCAGAVGAAGAASGVGSSALTPAPTRTPRRRARRADRGASRAPGAARGAVARVDGSRRTRVRRHRQSTRSQMTSAPPSIAQRTHCAS